MITHLNASVLIPVYEETFLIAKHRERLSGKVRMVIPDYEQILVAHDKARWLAIADRLGIPRPKSYTIDEVTGRHLCACLCRTRRRMGISRGSWPI